MTMPTTNTSLRDWNQDNVGKWLCSVNLGYLTVKFEILRIDGVGLLTMDDSFIDTNLRLNPAERTAFTGALHCLRSSPLYGSYPSPRSATLPNNKLLYSVGSDLSRPRFDSEATKIVKIHHQTSDSPKPEVKLGPVRELLKNCRHSGWIRKQGGSHKGFRQRYMVLRLGHLYYYDKETSLKTKGYFSIQGYSVIPCTEVYKGKPWCFKMVPDDPNERTYVVSTGAEHEMKKWMQEIQDEIFSYEDHVYDPVAIEDVDDDFEDCDDEGNYEKMEPEEIYDNVDDDSGYVRITKGGDINGAQTFPRTSTLDQPLSPNHHTPHTIPRPSPSLPHVSPLLPHVPPSLPHVPPRSIESLVSSGITNQEKENPYYIKLIESDVNTSTSNSSHASSKTPNSPIAMVGSVPVDNGSPFTNPCPPRRSTDSMTRPIIKDQYTEEEISQEDPYYIKLGGIDDVMPSDCLFGTISREEAVRRLTMDSRGNAKYTSPGTYLIRDSSHQDVLHVLSVWTGTECKHYKMFAKENSEESPGMGKEGYCLTQGKMFPSIPLLLSHYKQECLPKSPKVTLSVPYHPHDH